MKKLMTVLLSTLLVLAACQQKQEQAPQQSAPAAPMSLPTSTEINMLREAAMKEPGNAGLWINLGNIFMDGGKFPDAVDAYGKALAIDPKNVDVRVDMGTCLKNSGKPDRAVEEYKKALQINPNHLNANKNLGVVLTYDLNNRKEGIKAFEKYLEIAPMAPDAQSLRQVIQELKAQK